MTDQNPLISIAMPVYNAADTVGIAIKSILWQTYQNWELLILDDGSTDQTVAVVQSFSDSRIKLHVGKQNRRLAYRLNQAADLATGTYYARMDADDIAYPTRLQVQLAFMRANPNVDLVGSQVSIIDDQDMLLGRRDMPLTHAELVANPHRSIFVAHPTWFGKLNWFRANPYSELAREIGDRELLQRTYQQSQFANVDQILLAYRETYNFSKKAIRMRKSVLRVLRHQPLSTWTMTDIQLGLVQVIGIAADHLNRLLGREKQALLSRVDPISAADAAIWQTHFKALHETP